MKGQEVYGDRGRELLLSVIRLFESEKVAPEDADYILEAMLYTNALGRCLFEHPSNRKYKILAEKIADVLISVNASDKEAEFVVRGARIIIKKVRESAGYRDGV